MRFISAVLVLNAVAMFFAAIASADSNLGFEHSSAAGRLTVSICPSMALEVLATPQAPDILYPEGTQLARLAHSSGAIITLSFDHSRTFTEAQQKAFYEVVGEAAEKGSPRHQVETLKGRVWTLQAFHSPQESIITAQTFIESHALGVIFWLPTADFSTSITDDLVLSVLDAVHIQWEK